VSVAERAVDVVPFEPPRAVLRAVAVSVRPHQWVKNLLVLAAIVFAAELGDPVRVAAALVAFVSYCAASSAAYLINDAADVDADRRHPVKRHRPLACGEIGVTLALVIASFLLGVAFALAAALGVASLVCLVAFVALQAAYTLRLKALVFADALAISALFVLRAVAGALAIDVSMSPWLLGCTGLLALLLILGKRRAELSLVERTGTASGRAALARYTVAGVDRLLAIVAASTIAAYVVYTLVGKESHLLLATVPLVVYGVARYVALLRAGTVGEEPARLLVTDRPILGVVSCWAALCAVLLAVAG
jgi:4-hydroxybenzoate polyprenyltransferase